MKTWLKKNGMDMVWVGVGAATLFSIASDGSTNMTGWDWFMFVWCAMAVGWITFTFIERQQTALFAYIDRKAEERDAT